MFKLYERKMEPFNDYSSPAAGSHENIHRAKARGWLYAALIQEVFSQARAPVLFCSWLRGF